MTRSDLVLDIGAGSGGIAASIGAYSTVYATDRTDQRTDKSNYSFVLANESLPFPDDFFDVAVSNHVIEHVRDARRHLEEIRRVLKPSGLCYVATPNRWWPFEVHSRVALLHWLPTRLFNRSALNLGRLHEPVVLLSLRQLRVRAKGLFALGTWHDQVVLDPTRYALTLPRWAETLLNLVPRRVVFWSRHLHPTIIAILRPIGR